MDEYQGNTSDYSALDLMRAWETMREWEIPETAETWLEHIKMEETDEEGAENFRRNLELRIKYNK